MTLGIEDFSRRPVQYGRRCWRTLRSAPSFGQLHGVQQLRSRYRGRGWHQDGPGFTGPTDSVGCHQRWTDVAVRCAARNPCSAKPVGRADEGADRPWLPPGGS